MMDVKNSNLKPKLFSDVITRIPTLSWKLLNEILKKCKQSEKPRAFMLVKSFELCALIFKSCQITNELKPLFIKGVESFNLVAEEFSQSLPALNETGPYSMPKDRLKTMLKSIVAIIRKSKTSLSAEEFANCWKGTKIGIDVVGYLSTDKFANQKALKSIANEINKLL